MKVINCVNLILFCNSSKILFAVPKYVITHASLKLNIRFMSTYPLAPHFGFQQGCKDICQVQ